MLGLVFSAGGASAQTDTAAESSCVTVDFAGAKLIIGGADRTAANPVTLPAGIIDIPSARSSDGYPSRGSVAQNSEKYEIEFLSASGAIIATSAPSGDVPDFLVSAEWTGSLGSVTLSEPAVAVRAHHRPDLPGDNSPQSVLANEVTFCFELPAAPVCGDDGVTTNPDGTPCEPTTPVCGDDGVTTNPDGTPCEPTTVTTAAPSTTTVPETTSSTEGEVAGPTTSTTTAPTTAAPTTAAPTTAAPTTGPSTTVAEEVAGPTSLALTGSNSALLFGFGGLLLAAGIALVGLRRQAA
jgi:hypothetical protein